MYYAAWDGATDRDSPLIYYGTLILKVNIIASNNVRDYDGKIEQQKYLKHSYTVVSD